MGGTGKAQNKESEAAGGGGSRPPLCPSCGAPPDLRPFGDCHTSRNRACGLGDPQERHSAPRKPPTPTTPPVDPLFRLSGREKGVRRSAPGATAVGITRSSRFAAGPSSDLVWPVADRPHRAREGPRSQAAAPRNERAHRRREPMPASGQHGGAMKAPTCLAFALEAGSATSPALPACGRRSSPSCSGASPEAPR